MSRARNLWRRFDAWWLDWAWLIWISLCAGNIARGNVLMATIAAAFAAYRTADRFGLLNRSTLEITLSDGTGYRVVGGRVERF